MQILITESQTIYAQVEGVNFQGVFCDGSLNFSITRVLEVEDLQLEVREFLDY